MYLHISVDIIYVANSNAAQLPTSKCYIDA